MSSDKKVCKVNDSRLSLYTKRTRSGSEQVFYTGNDERDFERYRAEGGTSNHNVKMNDKPDTIRIQPSEKHYYAELIDGEWWWLNGCAECNGRPRDWVTYIECSEHSVCAHCGCSYSELTEAPWGRKNGWVCKPCADKEHEIEKTKALASMPDDEDFDDYDYHGLDEIKCPHCDYKFSDSWGYSDDDESDHDCPRCDNTFTVTAVPHLTFDCSRKG